MNYISVGDMAQTYQMRLHNTQLKTTLNRLSEEVVTGIQKDVGKAVGGDFTMLSSINRSISAIASYDQATAEAGIFADAMQNSLDLMRTSASEIGVSLMSAATSSTPTLVNTTVATASDMFSSIVDALNTNVSGRYVFSGTATDTKPLDAAEDILSALGAHVAGLTTSADIEAAVEAWFMADPGDGGFIDQSYHGSQSELGPIRVADGQTVKLQMRAVDPEIREALAGFALAALVSNNYAGSDFTIHSELAQASGERIVAAGSTLASLQAGVGSVQGRISDAQTQNAAEKSSLEIARTNLIGADPYDSATALEAAQSQLETLYTLTARLSSLSLADYL